MTEPVDDASKRTTVFDGRRAVWQWMFTSQGEQDMAAVAGTLQQYAHSDIVLVKVMDGQSWEGYYDYAPAGIHNLDEWHSAQTLSKAHGVDAVAWVVPHNAGDAAAHAALGNTLVVDLEPPSYRQFWQDTIPNIAVYLQSLRAAGVINLYVSIDARPDALAEIGWAGWAHLVDGVLPQIYWTDFSTPAMSNLGIVSALQASGVPVIPVLPYDAQPGDLSTFWSACQKLGCAGASLWRLGSANIGQLQAFGDLPVGAAPSPCDDLRVQLAAANQRVSDLLLQIAPLQSQVADLGAKLDAVRRDVA